MLRSRVGLFAAALIAATTTDALTRGPDLSKRPVKEYGPSIDPKHDKQARKAQRPRWRR